MKRLGMVLAIVMLFTLVFSATAFAGVGNNAPSGQHFTLNIIGVENPKTAPMDDSNRHTIFVPLKGVCGIGLTEAPYDPEVGYSTKDFQVLDGNCFDKGIVADGVTYENGLSAGFQLPPPDPALTGTLQYTVWAKVTSPTGQAKMQTCFYDTTAGETYCNTGYMLDLTKASFPKFVNVSKSLLTVCAVQDDGSFKLEPLFSDDTTYWWEYNNDGLRHAQLRFYPYTADSTPYADTLCTPGAPTKE